MRVVSRADLARPAAMVAPDLLNKLLISRTGGDSVIGRIIEVEAYDDQDPASHTYAGPTKRNAVMFGPAGHLYVYLSYGIHRCANVVTGERGHGEAVLIRSVEIESGHEVAVTRRKGRSGRELSNGPGKVCQALAIDLDLDGIDVVSEGVVQLIDDGLPPPPDPRIGPRVGISKGIDTPWRFRMPLERRAS